MMIYCCTCKKEKVQDNVKKSHNMTENEQKSEKTAQDVQKNCLSLTEQWKKGELENDWYYIRTANGIEKWEYIKQSHGFGYYETDWVSEVLAPVPSYERIEKLEELLYKCYRFLRLTETNVKAIEEVKQGIVKQIDEVLK